jgi:hypothetical protein
VTHDEGPAEQRPEGFYYSDHVHVTAGFLMWQRLGLAQIDLDTESYLKDRFTYDNKVFRVKTLSVLGQVQRRDIIISMDGDQMRADEFTGDPQFAAWAIISGA